MDVYYINPKKPSAEAIKAAADVIKGGSVIAHPTETVYGLAANIFDEKAVQRIFDIKGRRTTKPLSLMVDNIEKVESIVGEIRPFARRFMEHFLPGSVTVILPFNKPVDLPFFKDRTNVGIRIPDYPFCLELLKEVNVPLTTTSANKSGLESPILAAEVISHFNGDIDLLVDGGKMNAGLSSTVVDLADDKVVILREGAVSSELILSFV